MMRNCKLNKYLLIPILIFVLAVGLRAYRVTGKTSLFTDENLSIVLSNYGTYGYAWPAVAANDSVKSYEGSALRYRIFYDDNSLKNILYDLWNLRKSTRDTPHTNLYYSFLRLSFWGADTTNLSDVVNRAFLLNILVFSLGFFFMCRLARLLFNDNWILVSCILGVMAFNPISVSNTIFMREYQLQETMFIILTYVILFCAYKLYRKGSLFPEKKYAIGLLVVTSISLLPGYFGVPYVLMMWAGLGLYVLIKSEQRWRSIGELVGIFIGAIVLLFLIYPAYLDGFSGDRGEQAAEKLSILSIFGSLGEVASFLCNSMGTETVILLLVSLVLGIVFLRKANKKSSFQQQAILFIIVCAVIWLFFTFYLAPVKKIRYIASIFPLLCLVIPFLLSFISNKLIQGVLSFMTIFFFMFQTVVAEDVYWGRVDVGEDYKNDVKTPLVVGGVFSPWLQTSLTPYFTDGRTIEFAFNMKELTEVINKYDKVYVVLGGEEMVKLSIPDSHVIMNEPYIRNESIEAIGPKYKIRRSVNAQ